MRKSFAKIAKFLFLFVSAVAVLFLLVISPCYRLLNAYLTRKLRRSQANQRPIKQVVASSPRRP